VLSVIASITANSRQRGEVFVKLAIYVASTQGDDSIIGVQISLKFVGTFDAGESKELFLAENKQVENTSMVGSGE